MEPIPAPEVLDPNRVSRDDREDMTREDHRTQGQLLAKALDRTSDYAQHLWNDLARMRQYLHDSLPPELGDDATPRGTSPDGPGDDDGWQRWVDAFAEVTSVLCGPHGDSGYGRSSAQVLAQSRRVRATGMGPSETPSASDDVGLEAIGPAAAVGEPAATRSEPTTFASRVRAKPFAVVGPLLYGALGALVATAVRRR